MYRVLHMQIMNDELRISEVTNHWAILYGAPITNFIAQMFPDERMIPGTAEYYIIYLRS